MIIDYTLSGPGVPLAPFGSWRKSILVVRKAVVGTEMAKLGSAASAHRPPSRFQMIDFGRELPIEVLRRNGLQDVSARIKLNDIQSLARCLQTYGPLIVCGKFGLMSPNPVVIRGCDTQTGDVMIYDAAFGQGNSTKSWSFIADRVRKVNQLDPAPTTFIADDPHPSEVVVKKKRR